MFSNLIQLAIMQGDLVLLAMRASLIAGDSPPRCARAREFLGDLIRPVGENPTTRSYIPRRVLIAATSAARA